MVRGSTSGTPDSKLNPAGTNTVTSQIIGPAPRQGPAFPQLKR